MGSMGRFCLPVASTPSEALRVGAEELQADREFVREAVAENGLALE